MTMTLEARTLPDALKLKRKVSSVSSMLIMLQRTIDSPDCCVYTKEMSSVLGSAIEAIGECEELSIRLAGDDSQ